ncbi:HNH endonuclease signature motif containing protein [Nocardioides sp. Kera G14]|uniref:HNH endonuclease signature motif containing protein n=1 Tax=Nocardioides sp. Kera G14 TaxID=2884264 RepID=UPI001D106F93|nr:HNH endonuclease signature motif containing protein [Nocardioides sp. Kera G14]UDY25061.1 HNH endonuclease [Nocardioides sp. Kera G14]
MSLAVDAGSTENILGPSVGMPIDNPLAMIALTKHSANMAEIASLLHTIDWAQQHTTNDQAHAASGDRVHDIPLAGEGTPWIDESALMELAAETGMSEHQARSWVGDALELHHRLPKLFFRLYDEQLPVWKARLVAQASRVLTVEGAAWLDKELHMRFEKIGPTALKRFIAHAIDRFDPDEAARRAEAAADARKIDLCPQDDGTDDLYGKTDHADGLDLEAAIQKAAADLKEQGSDESLDVRRSKALGVIARHYLAGTTAGAVTRVVNLYVHADSEGQFTTEGGTGLTTLTQLREWSQTSNTKFILRPVIDLNQRLHRTGYVPSVEMREQAILTDKTCVAPNCERNARTADLDHIEPYDKDHPDRGGPTSSDNLACLCRYHHRMKTFTHWTYTKLEPGYYLWRSPAGKHHLRTPSGTIKLG